VSAAKLPLQWKNLVGTIDVILQGGGEHARVVLDCLLAQKRNVMGLFDPKYNDSLFGVKQFGVYRPEFAPEALAIVAVGDNALRKKIALLTKHNFTNAIHPSAIISPFIKLGVGCMILHGTIIQAQTFIGNHAIINTGARVDHDCQISEYVHVAPAAVLCGSVQVGEGTFVGAGAVVIPGKKIGRWATIGAGAVVVHDIPDYAVAVGNPARIIRYNQL
jgi:sugar O-acyltransferase (sialic acid O-acetyltransferase NeuD family)